jgi:hypothetical protein
MRTYSSKAVVEEVKGATSWVVTDAVDRATDWAERDILGVTQTVRESLYWTVWDILRWNSLHPALRDFLREACAEVVP